MSVIYIVTIAVLAYLIVGLVRGYWELEEKLDQRINALEEELDTQRTKMATEMYELEQRLRERRTANNEEQNSGD